MVSTFIGMAMYQPQLRMSCTSCFHDSHGVWVWLFLLSAVIMDTVDQLISSFRWNSGSHSAESHTMPTFSILSFLQYSLDQRGRSLKLSGLHLCCLCRWHNSPVVWCCSCCVHICRVPIGNLEQALFKLVGLGCHESARTGSEEHQDSVPKYIPAEAECTDPFLGKNTPHNSN